MIGQAYIILGPETSRKVNPRFIIMKNLAINWLDLESAFETLPSERGGFSEISNYFDTETGQVVTLDETVNDAVEEILESLEEVVANGVDWTDADIRNTATYESLSEWLKPSVFAAIQIECGVALERFRRIPQFDAHQVFHWMEDFVDTVRDELVRARLKAALNQRKPFRNFREAMGSDRRLERQWRDFQLACQRETVIVWLASMDIEPLNPDEPTYDLPPLPDLRKIMFTEVRRFVRFARDLPGLQRIALIGSLASDKEFPKDIDLLVTIADDCDLAVLATLSRQLTGHMAAHSAGADVFLASPDGEYLGRICLWKRCGPGIRSSCDALSCGVRHYLHDDLQTIQLSKELILQPPVQLWPETAIASACPSDVLEQLIQPLATDSHR